MILKNTTYTDTYKDHNDLRNWNFNSSCAITGENVWHRSGDNLLQIWFDKWNIVILFSLCYMC